ncbi:MAG: transposase, partial [bacterium]|nr:transposase [bacterium]
AIPVAWVVLEAGEKKAWRREWLGMLRQLRAAVPRGWTMMVLADRGLYGRWLFRRIIRLGWHPFLRINNGGTFWPEGSSLYRPLLSLVSEMGTEWSGRGTAFKGRGRQLDCTLLARWDTGHQDPWLILTDLPPEASDAAWYGLRAWIERGFKVTKREGWQWQQTRMSDPGRASRLRLVSVFRRGWIKLIIALIRHEPLPQGRFVPEPWLRSPEAEEEEVIEATECWTRPPNL